MEQVLKLKARVAQLEQALSDAGVAVPLPLLPLSAGAATQANPPTATQEEKEKTEEDVPPIASPFELVPTEILLSWRVSILKANGMFQTNCIVCIKRQSQSQLIVRSAVITSVMSVLLC